MNIFCDNMILFYMYILLTLLNQINQSIKINVSSDSRYLLEDAAVDDHFAEPGLYR